MTRTYGSIHHNAKENQWEICCEPHVVYRLKRVFGKIDVRQHGTLTVTASRENSRDLEWFIERYPMVVEPADKLHELASEHRDAESLIHRLISGVEPTKEFQLLVPPREYQTLAANVWHASQGLLLGDDVGLGKTVSAICGLTQGHLLPTMVTTLSHLPIQWAREVKRFTGLNVHILTKGQPYDLTKNGKQPFPDVIVTNYHKLSGWAETLAPLVRSLIFDEAQELRHSDSNKYAAARFLASSVPYRIGLSATPIFGYGGEIYNVLEVLRPGQLGTYEEFSREWCVVRHGKHQIANPVAFGQYLRESGAMLRRTMIEVKREVPPITVVPHHIDADPKVLLKMKGRAIELAKLILGQGEAFKGQKMQAAGEFDMRMRQETGIAKAPYTAEFVKFLHEESGEKIVLFGWHRECYSIWLEKLKDLKPVMYTGTETPAQKEASRTAFVEGDSKVLIISLRSGAGLDGLQSVCHIAVFGELDWSPAVHEQAIGRLARDGQISPVVAYYLLSEHGSDPVISDVLGVKKQQLEGIRDPSRDMITRLQVEADYIKKLAERFLQESGEEVPTSSVEAIEEAV